MPRGPGGLQVRQAVLGYVLFCGCITRQETMEMCRVDVCQAQHLLQQLVKAGKMARSGREHNMCASGKLKVIKRIRL
jgi:hypothetical protein